jgi:hypothetical protein
MIFLFGSLAALPASAARMDDTEEPIDAGLEDEATIIRKAKSDPRNLRADAFPVIREPQYSSAVEAKDMDPEEWVIGVVLEGVPLAFPTNVLNQHEILIDTFSEIPFMVCWCPLCRTGVVHLRTLDGEVLDFGHSGMLYHDAFLLYDRRTGSLWHNAMGRGLTGEMRGRQLETLPSRFVKWDVWRKAHPDTRVLGKDRNDSRQARDTYANLNLRVGTSFGLGVLVDGTPRLYEFSKLAQTPVVLDRIGRVPIVVLWDEDTETAVAWRRILDGRVLSFRHAEDGVDGLPRLEDTGEGNSVFNAITGRCLEGPLKGESLDPVLSSYWEVNAWIVHHRYGSIYRARKSP